MPSCDPSLAARRRRASVLIAIGLLLAALAAPGPALAQAFAPGATVDVRWKGYWYKATILQAAGGRYKVHYIGWDTSWDEWVAPARVRSAHPWGPGSAVLVEWRGRYYPAHVIAAKPLHWKIHYDGYGAKWDEWVGPRRVRSAH